MHPRDRLARSYPGEGLGQRSDGFLRLLGRERVPRPVHVSVGEGFLVRPPATRTVRVRVANPRPSAPLLKRLVRHPYRLHTVRCRRRVLYAPREDRVARRGDRRSAVEEMRLRRAVMSMDNPLRDEGIGIVDPYGRRFSAYGLRSLRDGWREHPDEERYDSVVDAWLTLSKRRG